MTADEAPGLGMLTPNRLTGAEKFLRSGRELSLTVGHFWQWSMSDLVSNLARGRLAEFIVAHALGIEVQSNVRNEWDAFDLTTSDGVKVEVKSSAYVQSWHQKRPSAVGWRLGPTRAWDRATNEWSTEIRWQARVYVLALLEQQAKGRIAPLDLDQWRFFVVPVCLLEERKQTLTLRALGNLGIEGVGFDELASNVSAAAIFAGPSTHASK